MSVVHVLFTLKSADSDFLYTLWYDAKGDFVDTDTGIRRPMSADSTFTGSLRSKSDYVS
jgi:hypothetical protein